MRLPRLAASAALAAAIAVPLAAPAAASGYSDPFFHAPPADPGALIADQPMPLAQFPGSSVDRLLFGSTDAHGGAITAAATLVRPPGMRTDAPIVAYDHFANTLNADCQPTASLTADFPEGQLVAAEMTAANIALARGWAVLLVDHEGPDAAYAVNTQSGHITLDALRAATDARYRTASSPAVAAGYSGGSSAAYFAASMQPTYAPDVNLVGVAAGGVPADYHAQIAFGLRGDGPHPGAGLAIAAALGMQRQYPGIDVRSRLNPAGDAIADRMESSCTQTLLSVGSEVTRIDQITPLSASSLLADPAIAAALSRESAVNTPAPQVPVYLWQSPNDGLLPYGPVVRLAGEACAAGTPTVLSQASGTDHLTVALTGLPDALDWIAGRFAGAPAPSTC